MNGEVLHVSGLRVGFGRKRVLDGLDLRLVPGRVTVLLGQNGTGTSTLLRVRFGVLRPYSPSWNDALAAEQCEPEPARVPQGLHRVLAEVSAEVVA